MIAGAAAVQVGTANFVEPLIWTTLVAGIEDYLVRHEASRVSNIVGSLIPVTT
jgi:dihydroorotate dehydrogenase (NAD+) catalytic subunit